MRQRPELTVSGGWYALVCEPQETNARFSSKWQSQCGCLILADLNEAEAADATRGRFERQLGNWDSVGSPGGPCDAFKKNDAR
jgi:hypothetical protein